MSSHLIWLTGVHLVPARNIMALTGTRHPALFSHTSENVNSTVSPRCCRRVESVHNEAQERNAENSKSKRIEIRSVYPRS